MKDKLGRALKLTHFLFEEKIPFKYKRIIVQIFKIEMTIPSRGKVKTELVIDSQGWERGKMVTLDDLYKNSLSKIL